MNQRKIIHVDMDAFYASVEQRDFPELKGKPVAVGGSKERGVVAAASYEARKFGIRSAMPSITAARKCPSLIFVKPRFEVYKEISHQIRAIFYRYTDLVEPLSLDEAYLDVTRNKKQLKSGTLIAEEIRQQIMAETGLSASAGISVNKFLAKIASDLNKPNGLTLIRPNEIDAFIAALPVKKFFGVGKVTAAKMLSLGIESGSDLQKLSLSELIYHFGKTGRYYHNICRGIDDRAVQPDRQRKSIGAERTFSLDLDTTPQMMEALESIASIVFQRMRKEGARAKTVTLKLKYTNFELHTRSRTLPKWVETEQEIIHTVGELLTQNELDLPVRLLGISLSNLEGDEAPVSGTQLTLDF